jgi:cobalamin biosynthesis protein CobT
VDKDVAKPASSGQVIDSYEEFLEIKNSADVRQTTAQVDPAVFYTNFVDNIVRKDKDQREKH